MLLGSASRAVVFATEPIAFAVRKPLPGTDLDAGRPGGGKLDAMARPCRELGTSRGSSS